MPRFAMTSNLCEFPHEVLLEASRILTALAYDHELRAISGELTISYTPSTGNVFLVDNEMNIWVLKELRNNKSYYFNKYELVKLDEPFSKPTIERS